MKILYVLFALVLFGILILSHELGHFIAAKLCGVKVLEFSIGMGPEIISKVRGETQYSLRAFPLGGFCSLLGEEDSDDEEGEEKAPTFTSDDPRSLLNKTPLQKIMIYAAGPLMNILFCMIGLVILYMIMGYSLGISLRGSFRATFMLFQLIKESLQMLLGGQVGADEMVGVVGMVDTMSETVKYGLLNTAFLTCFLSLNLGTMNLLPVPALDGGRILFEIIRFITRGKFSQKAESYINGASMILLFGLMIFLMIKDTIRIFN